MRIGVLIGVVATIAATQAAPNHQFVSGASSQTSSASSPPAPGACGGWASKTFDDGCAGAPPASAYTVQHPDFFSGYARQSGQSYVTTGGCKGSQTVIRSGRSPGSTIQSAFRRWEPDLQAQAARPTRPMRQARIMVTATPANARGPGTPT